jgi:hypothetical protein
MINIILNTLPYYIKIKISSFIIYFSNNHFEWNDLDQGS